MGTKLAFLAAVVCVVVVAAPATEAAITSCGGITKALVSCLPYIQSGKGPTLGCCTGVKALVSAAQTTADRRTACGCIKQAASAVPGFYKYAPSLPGKCGTSIPYPISPNTDCSKIN